MTVGTRRQRVRTDRAQGDDARVVAAFSEVAVMTTTGTVPLPDILRLVGRRLCDLLGVSRCSVYLRRADGRFQGQVGHCAGRSIDAGVRRLVSGGDGDRFTAEIVAGAAPVVVHDASHDPRTIQRTMREWGVVDMLGVPLVVDGDVIGIIYADNQSSPREYTAQDISLARAFAGLSALAVQQAWLYQQLRERARVIDHQRRVLDETTLVQTRVTQAVLDGVDAAGILDVIAATLGRPVTLYDPTPAAVSAHGSGPAFTGPLGPAQLAEPWARAAIDRLTGAWASTLLPARPETRHRRLWVRMAVDGQVIGYLEACEVGRPFGDADARALEQAAMALAVKLVTDQRAEELFRQERDEYVLDLLYGRRDHQALLRKADGFGLHPSAGHVVVLARYWRGETGAAQRAERRERLGDLLAERLAGAGTVVATAAAPDADLILAELPGGETAAWVGSAGSAGAALRAAFDDLSARLGVRYAVLSGVCRTLRDLPGHVEAVRDIARVLHEADATARFVIAGDLAVVRLIAGREGLPGAHAYADALLRPLAEHDAATGGALLATLEAFLRCDAQVRQTAVALSVHENTVRYRLKRIRDVSSIDPERLDSLVAVAVALRTRLLVAGP
ncbi:GAF domain-containing protein [Dactylosporangium sp. NPDC048998]|uniref:GAF domain-containing protein n=1 Tax=Dactylosporangium sp. NPDC048998 TaxID=3363976 RepID=UPI0037158593